MDHTEKAAFEEEIQELRRRWLAEKDHHRYWHAVATGVLSMLAFETALLIGLAFIVR